MPYDSPETSKEPDILGRWPLAVNVFDLIRSTPEEWSLRIGIYGRWGEGKTTVLKFIESLSQAHGFKTAWFNPWAVQDKNQLWNAFAAALKDSFKQPLSLKSKGWFSGWSESATDFAKAASSIHVSIKIISTVAEKLSKHLAITKSDIEPLLASLGDKKLVDCNRQSGSNPMPWIRALPFHRFR